MARIENLERRIGEITSKIEKNAQKLTRKVAMAADQAVVMATPVDTGRARANWITSLRAPVLQATENMDKTGQSALAQGASVISGFDPERDGSIHITNNLPYIEPLNNGSSRQAAAGFVQAGVKAAAKVITGAKLLEGI